MGGALAIVASLVFLQWSTLWETVLCSVLRTSRLLMRRKIEQEKPGIRCGEEEEEGASVDLIHHQFECKVRYAFVNLDTLPSWFAASSRHHMTAEQARALVGTCGPVYLLCMPKSVGCGQNPISVYSCYEKAAGPHGTATLSKIMAEVTNTPWGDRVTFAFDSNDYGIPKPLHVSPFVDMEGNWRIDAPAPGEQLYLTVRVEHPDFGNCFLATLRARKVGRSQSPEAFLGLMPQKVALWIHVQALFLLWKGVAFVQHPKYAHGGNTEPVHRIVMQN